jgi:dTDP-4-amino-4,6-dideoxygalactose transaminase
MSLNKKIWLSLAQMGGSEMKFIQEAFDTNWVVPLGPNVDGFEGDLQGYLGVDKHIVALSSGTAAIHLALIQLGVRPGDEVICQSFTFSASANPIMYLGAIPVFVDSERDTWNMCPVLLEEAIRDRIAVTGKRPRAIIPVHLYGMPAKMDEILEVAGRYEILRRRWVRGIRGGFAVLLGSLLVCRLMGIRLLRRRAGVRWFVVMLWMLV